MDLLTLLVGTYTSGESEGVYCYHFNQETAMAVHLSSVRIDNPSFMTLNDSADRLYVITENNDEWDAVTRFGFNKSSGEFCEREKVLIDSKSPCYIIHGDSWIGVANYGGGTVTTFPLNHSGELLPYQQQIGFDGDGVSRMHCLIFSPDRKYIFATDLGKDSIYKFKVASKNEIESGAVILQQTEVTIKLAKGDGPRHLIFSANGMYAYLINEKGRNIAVFDYKDGDLLLKQSLRMDEITDCGGGGDIHISPDGNYLYASNRLKNDGIAIFKINSCDGLLTRVGYCNTGIHPRNFTITPNGEFMLVACKDSHRIELYSIDKLSGGLKYMGSELDIVVDSPVFVHLIE